MSQIRDDISRKIPAKHVFYVMDACYGGLLAETRAVDKQTKRDFRYLQEITREPVRQVLTAGGKDQEVLDGGPHGHSVFTGRLIEELEKAEDFITANELQARVKEVVFSDARARNHTQTPGYGALYGVGDFVFVPSLERKVEDTQGKIDAYQAEIDRLNRLEQDAARARNDQQRRQVEIEKKQVEAKIAAEKLRQQTLEEQRRKREAEQRDEERRQAEAARQKKENEARIARLSKDVAEKRKSLEGAALSSLSPQKTLDEMQAIDRKIKKIREQFRAELKNGILQVVNRLNSRYLKLADARKDEFESEPEFRERIKKEKAALDREQADECSAVQTRLEQEYTRQIVPFIEELKKLSGQEFTITSENLTIELGTYDGVSNTYPVSIKAKKPLEIVLEQGRKSSRQVQAAATANPAQPAKKGKKQAMQTAMITRIVEEQQPPKMKYIMLASAANIPIPRDEAREFKQHFQNNMLRAELKGNFETPENFTIAEAKIIDDATVKSYSLFTAPFVDLGNGTAYDTATKLIWNKDGNCGKEHYTWNGANDLIANLNRTAYLGFRDWRLPTKDELVSLVDHAKHAGFGSEERPPAAYLNSQGFTGLLPKAYCSTTTHPKYEDEKLYIHFSNGYVGRSLKSNADCYVRCVRGGQ